MIGGVFGEVGEGRMIWSLNTALLALSRGGLKGSDSFSKFVARMEDCETPVEGAFAIKEAALGVVFCSTGLLIKGRTVAVGVELFPSLPLKGAIVGLFSEVRSGEEGRVEALGGGAGFVVEIGEEGDTTVIMVMTMMVDTTMAGRRSVHPVEIRPGGQTLTK